MGKKFAVFGLRPLGEGTGAPVGEVLTAPEEELLGEDACGVPVLIGGDATDIEDGVNGAELGFGVVVVVVGLADDGPEWLKPLF